MAEDAYLSLSGAERRALLDQALLIHGWVCCICGLPIELGTESLQHVVPRSKGGTNHPDNLRPAHRICNSKLGAKELSGPTAMIHDGMAFFLSRDPPSTPRPVEISP